MQKTTRTLILVSLLSLGFAGSSFAAEKKNSLKYWCGQCKKWVLPAAGMVGVPSFGIWAVRIGRGLWEGNKKANWPGLGTNVAGFLLSIWYCLDSVEKFSDFLEKTKETPKQSPKGQKA